MSGDHEHALELLRKAASDLFAAQTVLPTGRSLDAVCFHAQQAAEKSLKAVGADQGADYPYTHDLEELCSFAAEFAALPGDLVIALIPLTRFAVQVRYVEAADPDLDDARSALQTAHDVYLLAYRVINGSDPTQDPPAEPHP